MSDGREQEREPTVGERIALTVADQVAGWRGLAAAIDDALGAAPATPVTVELGHGRVVMGTGQPGRLNLYEGFSGPSGEDVDPSDERVKSLRLVVSLDFASPESVDLLIRELGKVKNTL